MRRTILLIVLVVLAAALEAAPSPTPIEVTVSEGTSMAVAVSPDGRTLAIDLQGSIWTLPATGGVATRLTDPFNDARQPTWSPDGQWITFFAYRDGGYAIWSDRPRRLQATSSSRGDRSTIASRSGRTTARASRSPPTAAIPWAATTTSGCWSRDGRMHPTDDGSGRRLHAHVVARRPGDRVRLDTRPGQSVWAVHVATGAERKVTTGPAASTRRRGGRAGSSSITTPRRARAASPWTAHR